MLGTPFQDFLLLVLPILPRDGSRSHPFLLQPRLPRPRGRSTRAGSGLAARFPSIDTAIVAAGGRGESSSCTTPSRTPTRSRQGIRPEDCDTWRATDNALIVRVCQHACSWRKAALWYIHTDCEIYYGASKQCCPIHFKKSHYCILKQTLHRPLKLLFY